MLKCHKIEEDSSNTPGEHIGPASPGEEFSTAPQQATPETKEHN
jgi:hypothetical protein